MTDHKSIQKEFSCISSRHTCDETLWLEFKNGDRRAFAMLYLRYYKILVHAGTGICHDGDMIMDCIHDLFVEMWKNRHGLGLPHSVKAYLIRSLQRKLLRLLKKRRADVFQQQVERIPDTETVPCVEKKIIHEQLRRERESDIRKAITVLTRRQQQAVYLRFYANLSYAEIAGKMAISTDSIYNLISKAMGNMQQELVRMPMRTL
ncbi:MAG: RNA polymerase sigma factor [Agriterribacter sp.]